MADDHLLAAHTNVQKCTRPTCSSGIRFATRVPQTTVWSQRREISWL